MACATQHRSMPTPERRRTSTTRRAAKLRASGRPSPKLAGTNPTTGRPPYSFNPAFAAKFSWSRSLVLMFFFLVPRVFGLVGALEAAVTAARKEPFLTDADPTSHRVHLWRGGSASNPAGACPSLQVQTRPTIKSWCFAIVLLFSFLADSASESVDAHVAVFLVAPKEFFHLDFDPASHQVRLWREGSASHPGGWRSWLMATSRVRSCDKVQ